MNLKIIDLTHIDLDDIFNDFFNEIKVSKGGDVECDK